MFEHSPDAELARIRRERDLYRRLLHLGAQNELGPLLSEALGLVVDVTGAHQGYLELHDDEERTGHPPLWIAHGFSAAQIEAVRGTISRGIIAHALATGQTVVTPSALLDPRFRDRDSVRAARIEAVLCAPIGADPPLGVLYLQGREQAGPFSEEDRANAELFTRHLAPLAERLLVRRRREEADATRSLRQALRLEGVIGRSAALAAVLRQAALLAPLDVNVLLTGESGTGKSQLARVIHDNGRRPRHARPGRDRRASAAVTGKAPPAPAVARVLPVGRLEVRSGGRTRDRRHQHGPPCGDRSAPFPRGPVLPPRGPARSCAFARREARGHSRVGGALLRPRRRAPQPATPDTVAGRAVRAPRGAMAGQRAPARPCARSGSHPRGGRERRADGSCAPLPRSGRDGAGVAHVPGGHPPVPGTASAGDARGERLERGGNGAAPGSGALVRLQLDSCHRSGAPEVAPPNREASCGPGARPRAAAPAGFGAGSPSRSPRPS